jgi:hypothetical protein
MRAKNRIKLKMSGKLLARTKGRAGFVRAFVPGKAQVVSGRQNPRPLDKVIAEQAKKISWTLQELAKN